MNDQELFLEFLNFAISQFSFNLHDKEVCSVYSLTYFGTGKYDCVINTK